MNNQYSSIQECVAHGLDIGWTKIHQVVRQPTKKQLLDALYLEVMQQLIYLVTRENDVSNSPRKKDPKKAQINDGSQDQN